MYSVIFLSLHEYDDDGRADMHRESVARPGSVALHRWDDGDSLAAKLDRTAQLAWHRHGTGYIARTYS
jgi:hypothetical protein